MVPQHVWSGMVNEMPDESMAGLVYPIGYRIKELPANTAQRTYKLAKCFGVMSSLTPDQVIHGESAVQAFFKGVTLCGTNFSKNALTRMRNSNTFEISSTLISPTKLP